MPLRGMRAPPPATLDDGCCALLCAALLCVRAVATHRFPLTPEDYVYKVRLHTLSFVGSPAHSPLRVCCFWVMAGQITDPETGAVTCELGVNVLPGASNYLFQIGDTFLRKYYAYFVAGDKMFGDNPRIGYAPAVHA